MRTTFLSIFFGFLFTEPLAAQVLATTANVLRGSLNENRTWWDVTYYDLTVTPDLKNETIEGCNTIYFKVVGQGSVMQVDLQVPLIISKIIYNNIELKYTRSGNVYLVNFPLAPPIGSKQKIEIFYGGKPKKALRPPWDGGLVWEKDKKGRPFVNTACQGLGASVWWPNKDHQSEEPDSMQMTFIVPKELVAVGNGRLRKTKPESNKKMAYTWFVKNPINNYDVAMNIGNYVNFKDTFQGEKGVLDLEYYVLDYNLEKAKKQFVQAKQTLRAFEYWFGPYPFYEDSYKLVESHHLGMEHQSAVAYGNQYMNGYLGGDLSRSGWGLKWDYIIVHESGHEWFGNNITTNDIADMWVHEGITDYGETLFTEYYYGKDAANQYNKGLRLGIGNFSPVIGTYGINKEGSGDMYSKGANLMHTIRQLISNDEKFRDILRGLGKNYYHKTTTSAAVENYISTKSGIDFSKVFDQYLRDIRIPVLSYYYQNENDDKVLYMKFTNCIKDFSMNFPVHQELNKEGSAFINVKDNSFVKLKLANPNITIQQVINPNIYIRPEETKKEDQLQ
jgi:aminopeptidase N